MQPKSFNLAWVVVADLEKARTFYKDILGFKETSYAPEFGWVELVAHEGGAKIGLAAANPHDPHKPGSNAVITVTVADIKKARAELAQKKVTLEGDIMEIPGHVKLQSFKDKDGNHFQLVELLS